MKKLIPFVCMVTLLFVPLTALSKRVSATFISLYAYPDNYIELRKDGTFKVYEGGIIGGGAYYGEYEIKSKYLRLKTELGWEEYEWHGSYIVNPDENEKWVRKPEPIKGKYITKDADFSNAKVGEYWELLDCDICLDRLRTNWFRGGKLELVTDRVLNENCDGEHDIVVYILDVGRHKVTEGHVYCLVWLVDSWDWREGRGTEYNWEDDKRPQEYRGWIYAEGFDTQDTEKILISPVEAEEEKRAKKERQQEKPLEKQISTMKDMSAISSAIADYVTDRGTTPTQDGTYTPPTKFYDALCPFYIKVLPINDQWGNNFRVYCGTACNGKYGITGADSNNFLVVSLGADGKKEAWKFDSSDLEAGLYIRGIYNLDNDLVMWNGSWIRAPKTAFRRCP